MTNAFPDQIGPADSRAGHVSEDLLSAYVTGSVDEVVAWSVEAHVAPCPVCRLALAGHVDPDRLARNRSVMLVRAAIGEDPAPSVASWAGWVSRTTWSPCWRRPRLCAGRGCFRSWVCWRW